MSNMYRFGAVVIVASCLLAALAPGKEFVVRVISAHFMVLIKGSMVGNRFVRRAVF